VASGARVDVAQAAGKPGEDIRPLFDELAAKLLNLSGAPTGVTADLAHATTASLEAYRSYLAGIDELNRWNLAPAERSLRRAVELDTTFGLAYYKLSLTRGWIAGQFDSAGLDAVHRATQHAERLPEHDRAMIEAYRTFLEGDYAKSRAAYLALLGRDSTDADAWYGLGDVDFHDPHSRTDAGLLGASLRAFKKAIALDADYYLAFEHLAAIYRSAADEHPAVALLPGDSIAAVHLEGGRAGLDSTQLALAVQRARNEGIASARAWLAHQPENVHAQNALIFALAAARQFDASLATVDRLLQDPATRWRADLPFVRAQVLTEQRDLKEAAHTVARALDSARPGPLSDSRLSAVDALGAVGNGANAAGFLGEVELTTRALDLFSDMSATMYPEAPGSQRLGDQTLLGHLWHSHIYTVLGAPAAKLRPIWALIADSARRAPKPAREGVVNYGWVAALGLYLLNPSDPGPLNELQALGGGSTPPELMALQALERGNSAEARRQLTLPDSMTSKSYRSRPQWWAYKHMIAANAWVKLGDDRRALQALEVFQPSELYSSTVDIRWLLAGQARMLRGDIYEHQGRHDLAREEYRQALAQWEGADPQLDGLVAALRLRLNKVG
jgi:tetratricopeptide (TPR) repeat protein